MNVCVWRFSGELGLKSPGAFLTVLDLIAYQQNEKKFKILIQRKTSAHQAASYVSYTRAGAVFHTAPQSFHDHLGVFQVSWVSVSLRAAEMPLSVFNKENLKFFASDRHNEDVSSCSLKAKR